MASCVAATCGSVLRSGRNSLVTTLLIVAVLGLLIHAAMGEVSNNAGTIKDVATKSIATPLNCAACPKQITTCHTRQDAIVDVKPNEGNANCLSCDKLLPIAKTQLNMNNRILQQLNEIRNNTPSTDPATNPSMLTNQPHDCKDIQAAGFNVSGRYIVYPADEDDPFPVFCDMETDGGGWTVFQRRQNGLVDFDLTWTEYKYGFGRVLGEHWLGNDKIHRLTSQKGYKLRVDLEDFNGNTRYAEYDQFLMADETLYYQLVIGDYSGDAGDSLDYHNGMKFSTKDRDLDLTSTNCAQTYKGAWWYRSCLYSNLNGDYLIGPTTSPRTGVYWYHWKGYYYSLKGSEMKIQPII